MRSLFLLALFMAVPIPAAGVTLVTPTTFFAGSFILACSVTNPSAKKSIEVEVELVDDRGDPVDSLTVSVEPGANSALGDPRAGFRGASCRYTFPGGRRKAIAYLSVYEGDLVNGRTIQVLDAR